MYAACVGPICAQVCARLALTLFGMNAGRDQQAVVGLVEIDHREVSPTGKARRSKALAAAGGDRSLTGKLSL